jgi:site-specific DNA-methyltransferase (adenine-specific)
MATMNAESVDAIVCDPPYGLSFMGKGWDHGVPGVDFWVEALRVLKPGGHLIAFGGTRTYHRLAVAIEDAGFEVRDCLMWLYGSGFPKSHDVSKAIDKQAGAVREVVSKVCEDMFGKYEKVEVGVSGSTAIWSDGGMGNYPITAPSTDLAKEWHGWGTALKPAYEPAILARKPLRGTVADNVAQWGVGGLNIDGCRVECSDNDAVPLFTKYNTRPGTSFAVGSKRTGQNTNLGRWPANVILDEEAAAALDAQSGVGGASRFFYTAKASRSEREAGLDGVEQMQAPNGNKWTDQDYRTGKTIARANHHPTVKPIALMRYMIRLVAPRGAVVLDPFMGSGSTGCASMVEGMQFIGIDITPEYVDIARRRIAWWSSSSPLDNTATMESHEENEA